MNINRVRIQTERDIGHVFIDDHEIHVFAVSFYAEVAEFPRITLDLPVDSAEINGDAEILLTNSSRQALIAMGWTPPKEVA